MANPFGDLTYNNKVIKPVLRPVEAIAGMYDTQTKNYEYAIDNYNKAQTALSTIPVDNNTKHVVQGAQKVLDEELGKIAEKGDFENYALNSKQLTYDLANKHGLSAVDSYNKQKAAYDESLKEVEGLTPQRAAMYKRDAERNAKPLQYDKDLKRWIGSYNGRQAIAEQNWGEKLLEATKGFQADTLPFTGENGEVIVRDAKGTGYVYSTTGERVTEQELLQFSKAYLANDPNFQAELQEDIYFDMSNMLRDDATGEMRAMTVSDLESTLPPRYLEEGRKMFGLGDGNLETELKDKNIAPEQFYSALKSEEKVERAAVPAVLKESYESYENKFLKLPEVDNGVGGTFGSTSSAIVDTYSTQQRTTADDLKNSATLYNTSVKQLETLKSELATVKGSSTRSPSIIKDLESKIAEQERVLSATIDKHSTSLNLAPEIKSEVEHLVNGNSSIRGLNISMAPMMKLIYKKMAGEDVSSELEQYIDQSVIEQTVIENSAEDTSPQGIKNGIELHKKRSIETLNREITRFSKSLLDKADNGELSYTENYGSWNLVDMKPEDARAHPAYQLEFLANNMPKGSSTFYRKMTHPGGLDVETYLREQYDLDVDDKNHIIEWENAVVDASIDAAKGVDGNMKPTVIMQVPIRKGDQITKVNVQAFVDEPSYNARYFESITALKNELVEKKNKVGLQPSEQMMLDRYNANLFDTTKYGTTFPTTQLYNAEDGDVVEFEFMEGAEKAKVEVATKGSPNGFSYFLIDDSGDKRMYYATDSKGNQTLVTKDQLEPNARGVYEYTPIGGNTPYDLRVMMGEMTSNVNSQNSADSNMVDLTSIFKADIKQGVIPKISNEVAPYAQNLKSEFPGLIITDALRPENVEYGSETSLHKEGKALDFRLNEDSKNLLSLSDREKRLFNIKSVGLHNGNHIHLEFL